MFEDLRGFLTHLESQKQLLRVKDEVGVKYEIAAGMRKTSDIEGPALLFENVKGYPGWRVLGGLFATRKLVALGLGVPQEQMLERYMTLEDKHIPPEIVSNAPCKEIKWTGDQIDLSKLPIVTHAGKDCGPTSPSACRSARIPTPAFAICPFTACWFSARTGCRSGRRRITTWAG